MHSPLRRAEYRPSHPPPPHPVLAPPVRVAYEHPEKVGKPDGVPHDIIGMLAYGIVLLSAASLIAWLWVGLWLAVLVFVGAGYAMVRGLPGRSRRERDVEARGNVVEYVHNHEHPHPRVSDGYH